MNISFLIIGLGSVLIAVMMYLLLLEKKRAYHFSWNKATEEDYKVISIVYLLLGMIMIFLGINIVIYRYLSCYRTNIATL